MKILCSALATLFLVIFGINGAQSANAEDDAGIDIAVEVLSSAGAPKISVIFSSPIGKPSDAAKVKVAITGLEPNRAVFFAFKTLPDAIARVDTDKVGALKTQVELPYGLEPGLHEMVAQTTFGDDETPAEYTLGTLYTLSTLCPLSALNAPRSLGSLNSLYPLNTLGTPVVTLIASQ